MKKLSDKIARAAHIKHHTRGTSNEISFSVLDAARSALDEEKGSTAPKAGMPGIISLFTLARRGKPIATPTKEKGLHLSSGEFVSVEDGAPSSGLATLPASTAQAPAGSRALAGAPASGVAEKETPAVSGSAKPPSARSAGAASRAAWQTPEEEVATRKRNRQRRKRFLRAALVAATLVMLVFGARALLAIMEQQQDVRDQLLGGIEDVEHADAAVVAFDELVVSVINDDSLELDAAELEQEYAALTSDLDESYAELEAAKKIIDQLQSDLTDNQEKDAANQAIAAINARINMIDAGRTIVEETLAARSAISYAQQGWDAMLAADALARDAAALVTNTTVDSVTASMEKSRSAASSFKQAADAFASAQNAYPTLDMSSYTEYVGLRLRAQNCAIASDQAYLDRDKETAAAKNDEYNDLDLQAVQLAPSIAKNPADTAVELLEDAISSAEASYSSERSIASGADAVLRAYLGTKNK